MIFPQKYTMYLLKGATFDYKFIWKDEAGALVNLTGYTARMHMREKVVSQPGKTSSTVTRTPKAK